MLSCFLRYAVILAPVLILVVCQAFLIIVIMYINSFRKASYQQASAVILYRILNIRSKAAPIITGTHKRIYTDVNQRKTPKKKK